MDSTGALSGLKVAAAEAVEWTPVPPSTIPNATVRDCDVSAPVPWLSLKSSWSAVSSTVSAKNPSCPWDAVSAANEFGDSQAQSIVTPCGLLMNERGLASKTWMSVTSPPQSDTVTSIPGPTIVA